MGREVHPRAAAWCKAEASQEVVEEVICVRHSVPEAGQRSAAVTSVVDLSAQDPSTGVKLNDLPDPAIRRSAKPEKSVQDIQ